MRSASSVLNEGSEVTALLVIWIKGLLTMKETGEQKIRISTYQKSCIVEYSFG